MIVIIKFYYLYYLILIFLISIFFQSQYTKIMSNMIRNFYLGKNMKNAMKHE